MKRARWLVGPIALTLLAACATQLSTPSPTPTPSPRPSPTATATTPPPTATHTPSATPTQTATPRPSPTPAPSPLRTPTPGITDLEIGWPEPPARSIDLTTGRDERVEQVPNARRTFWVTQDTGERKPIPARLRLQSKHAALWVEEGVWHDIRLLQTAAQHFDTHIYSTTHAIFDAAWAPELDGDPRVIILHVDGLSDNVTGYTSALDLYPRTVYSTSNQAEMVTVNLEAVEIASTPYYALLAQGVQRLIQWRHDPNEDRWVKEGLAELAISLNGMEPNATAPTYLEQPDTSLTGWDFADDAAHRGAAYLFMRYFYAQFGAEGVRILVAQPRNGVAGVRQTLAEMDAARSFEELFGDWLAANVLDGTPEESEIHGYESLTLTGITPATQYARYPATLEGTVRQYGAEYISLEGQEDLKIEFSGAEQTPLLALQPHSGDFFWWSNRADMSLSTLTRSFDLTGVQTATLTYHMWHDLEPGYDFVTLEVSPDGGQTWRILETPSGTGVNPTGNNPGWGYTGRSGDPPRWIEETVDLSDYAGAEIELRFGYWTDEAVTGAGFAVDDLAIPEIEYRDDVEVGPRGWRAAGFLRTDNWVPQQYVALLIGQGQQTSVTALPFPEDGKAHWEVPLASEEWQRAVLVISGLAPLTAQPAPYTLRIETTDPGS